MDNKPVSNYDLLKRIEALEVQLKTIVDLFEQGRGAVLFLKWMGSLAVGAAVIFAAIANWRFK